MYSYNAYCIYNSDYQKNSLDNHKYSTYTLNDKFGYRVGFAISKNKKEYDLFNVDGIKEGVVKLNHKGLYSVYDNQENKIYSNKPKGRFFRTTFGIISGAVGATVGLGLGYLIIASQ